MSIVLSYHNTCLTKDDVQLLENKSWLNDKLIGFMFEYFEYELYAGLQSSVAYISPEVTQFIKVIEVSHEVQVFLEPLLLKEKKVIFFAVNDNQSQHTAGGSHWSLLVFDNINSIFHHFDSLYPSNEYAAKSLASKVFKHISGSSVETYRFDAQRDCSQQQNFYDCGIYLICHAELISEHYQTTNQIIGFSHVTTEMTNAKRREIYELIISKKDSIGFDQ